MSKIKLAAVIPAYNEERHIAQVVQDALDLCHVIIVVDDASTDATLRCASQTGDARIELLPLNHNHGVGYAIRQGYRKALELGCDAALVLAGDGQMDIQDATHLIEAFAEGADYVKGNRLLHPSKSSMPWQRRLGSSVFAKWTSWICGQPIGDSQCGYTIAGRNAMKVLSKATWPSYGYPNEFLVLLSLADIDIKEVSVRAVYADEISGLSLRHALINIPMLLLRLSWRKLQRILRSWRPTKQSLHSQNDGPRSFKGTKSVEHNA